MTRAFISYARAAGSKVSELVEKELQSGGFKVWRDVRSLDAFNDFSVEIERAIGGSDVIVVCVTASIEELPDSFVRREILYAQAKNKPIVPLRISGATVTVRSAHLDADPFAHAAACHASRRMGTL